MTQEVPQAGGYGAQALIALAATVLRAAVGTTMTSLATLSTIRWVMLPSSQSIQRGRWPLPMMTMSAFAWSLYNGRTRQFIGRQTVAFSALDSRFEYYKYDALVADLPAAAPALRQALLSLAPKVADIVSAKPAP